MSNHIKLIFKNELKPSEALHIRRWWRVGHTFTQYSQKHTNVIQNYKNEESYKIQMQRNSMQHFVD